MNLYFHSKRKIFLFAMLTSAVLTTNLLAQSAPAGSSESIRQQMGASQMPQPAKNVSNQELKSFLAVNEKMQSVQIETQKKMESVIKEVGLSPKRYDEIAQSQMSGNSNADHSDEELKKAQNASNQMLSLQQQMHTKGEKVIKEEGLTPMRYQQIGMAIQQKPEIQQRYKELVENQK